MDRTILFYFDTDKRASPFDIYMAYDAGFDIVESYSEVTADETEELVQDAIFPGGPKGVKQIGFFLGGSDFEEVNNVLDAAKESMFGPFQAPIVVDPQGAYTTASALVAKAEAAVKEILGGNLEGKNVVVVAGTGPVGQAATELCVDAGADVTITETWDKKADEIKDIAEEISERTGEKIKGIPTTNKDEMYSAIKDADVILSTGAEGIRTIHDETLEKLEGKTRIVADTNAVPPIGIEGLDSEDDQKEIKENIYGSGALAVGNFKKKIELELLNQAKDSDKGVLAHHEAFELARESLID